MSVLKGRIGRARYWALTSVCMVAVYAGIYAVVATVNETSRSPVNIPATILSIGGLFIAVAACVTLFIIGVLRLHDRGRSGFWIIPYYLSPAVTGLLADGPELRIPALYWFAAGMLVWVIIDLGILKSKSVI